MSISKRIKIPNGESYSFVQTYKCDITGNTILDSDIYFYFGKVHISLEGMDLIVEKWALHWAEEFGTPFLMHELSEKLKLKKRSKYIPKKVRNIIIDKCNKKCVYCGATEKLQIDHILPISKGGTDDIRNLQILCKACNIKKSDKII